MSRVVFTKNAEPVDWLRIELRLQEISTSSSRRPIGISAAAMNDSQETASGGSGVIAQSSHPDIFQSAIALASDLDRFDRLAGNLV